MRLDPIVKSPTLLGKLMSRAMKHLFGKAFSTTQLIYNRPPGMWWMTLAIMRIEAKFKLDRELGLLIHTAASTQNGCLLGNDIARALAVQENIALERFTALVSWRTSNIFTSAEKSALAYV
jgi:alkylhydroperoxidase family enzyme